MKSIRSYFAQKGGTEESGRGDVNVTEKDNVSRAGEDESMDETAGRTQDENNNTR